MRETQEEIGLDLGGHTLLGRLDDRSAYSRGRRVDLSLSTFVFLQPPDAAPPRLALSAAEVSGARWVAASELVAEHIDWGTVRWPYAPTLVPPLRLLSAATRERLGLEMLEFPCLPLHRLRRSALDRAAPVASPPLPFDLWGLTFRLTEDLLALAAPPGRARTPLESEHEMPARFEDRGLGTLANAVARALYPLVGSHLRRR